MHLPLVATICSIVGWKITRRTSLTSPTVFQRKRHVETIFSRYGGQMGINVRDVAIQQLGRPEGTNTAVSNVTFKLLLLQVPFFMEPESRCVFGFR